jgi:hypothetical protein
LLCCFPRHQSEDENDDDHEQETSSSSRLLLIVLVVVLVLGCFPRQQSEDENDNEHEHDWGGGKGAIPSSAPEDLNILQNANDDGSSHDFSLPSRCQCGITKNA